MTTISSVKVPPSGPIGAKLLIIGEAPGRDEERELTPFVGVSGQLLNSLLERNGISRSDCRVTNICNYRPANNDFNYCKDTPQLVESLQELLEYIKTYPPDLIIGCGNVPLLYLCQKSGISNWRGSLINTTIGGVPYFCSYHPAFVIHSADGEPTLDFDFRKAITILKEGKKEVKNKKFIIDPKGYKLEEFYHDIKIKGLVAVDIESVKGSNHIICCGFATSNDWAICVVNHAYSGMSHEFESFCRKILEDDCIDKIFHNAIFDTQMFRLNGIKTESIKWDTMLAQHVLTPELPKDLGFLCSIYTDVPCYWSSFGNKDDEKTWSEKSNKERLYEYNCYDCIVTYEVFENQLDLIEFDTDFKKTFEHEMDLINVSAHISESGFLLDEERRLLLHNIVDAQYVKEQKFLNNIAGRDINVRSPKLKDYLYSELALPIRKDHDGNITTGEDALVSLIAFTKDKYNTMKTEAAKLEWKKKIIVLKLILKIRGSRQLLSSYLNPTVSVDGRLRSSWNIGGTETGRLSCSKFVDGSGMNAQTFPREIIDTEAQGL